MTDVSIVPIGKYKGQPVERLMADEKYSEWLLAQAWFLDRYADLAQLLRMGRLTEPQDTPEHNAMIAGLIDRQKETEALFASLFPDEPEARWAGSQFAQELEPRGGDILITAPHSSLAASMSSLRVLIEAKPLIGDDYPSVIRQVKAALAGEPVMFRIVRPVVIARKVETTNLSLDQVRRQFQLSGVPLLMESEFFDAGARRGGRAHV